MRSGSLLIAECFYQHKLVGTLHANRPIEPEVAFLCPRIGGVIGHGAHETSGEFGIYLKLNNDEVHVLSLVILYQRRVEAQ